MSKVSFEGIGAVVATFLAEDGVMGGQAVKMSANGKVAPCAAGDSFCGVAMEPRKGAAAVQVKGFVKVPATGSLALGWTEVAANGTGGIKAASGGRAVLVVAAENGSAVVCL